MKNLLNLAALPLDPFLAVHPSAEGLIKSRLEAIGSITAPEAEAVATAMTDSGERPYPIKDGVAVLALVGLMSKYSSWWFGGTSMIKLAMAVRQAKVDPDVKGILLVVDSPGGFVSGLSDLVADIQEAAAAKPFDVFIQDLGCSAAYMASAPARKITANPTATVGSVGIISVVVDASKALQQAGLRIIRLATGSLKAAGMFGTEVTEEQEQALRANINDLFSHFKAVIKSGRKLSDAQLEAITDGGTHIAPRAKQLKLIDKIGTLDDAMANLVARITSGVDGDDEDVDAQAAVTETAANPTISANGGGTGPASGAGTERTRPTPGGVKLSMNFKQILTRTLSALGMSKTATALTVATSEEPEAIASVMAEQWTAEVKDRLDNDPLMVACKANSINSPADLQKVLEMRTLGESHLTDLKAEAKAAAVRAYGGENGPKISAQIDTLPYVAIKAMRDSWNAEADAKFGNGDGQAATRKTKPAGSVTTAVDADETDDTSKKRAWERLTGDQRAVGLQMGMNTPAKQDAYAANVLGEVA